MGAPSVATVLHIVLKCSGKRNKIRKEKQLCRKRCFQNSHEINQRIRMTGTSRLYLRDISSPLIMISVNMLQCIYHWQLLKQWKQWCPFRGWKGLLAPNCQLNVIALVTNMQPSMRVHYLTSSGFWIGWEGHNVLSWRSVPIRVTLVAWKWH